MLNEAISPLVLQMLDFQLQFVVESEESEVGAEEVSSQNQHRVAFLAKQWTKHLLKSMIREGVRGHSLGGYEMECRCFMC